jgi:hypothetical protein
MFQLSSCVKSVKKLLYAGGRVCVNSVIRRGVRLVWNVVRSLPKLVRVCINLIIIRCALVVFLCVTFRVKVAVIYVTLLCLVAALRNAVNVNDV